MGKKKPKVRWTAVEENFFCSTSCSGDDEDSNVSSGNGGLNHNGNGHEANGDGVNGGALNHNGGGAHGGGSYNKYGGRRSYGGRRDASTGLDLQSCSLQTSFSFQVVRMGSL